MKTTVVLNTDDRIVILAALKLRRKELSNLIEFYEEKGDKKICDILKERVDDIDAAYKKIFG